MFYRAADTLWIAKNQRILMLETGIPTAFLLQIVFNSEYGSVGTTLKLSAELGVGMSDSARFNSLDQDALLKDRRRCGIFW